LTWFALNWLSSSDVSSSSQIGNLRTVEPGYSMVGEYPAATKLDSLVTPATSMQRDLAHAHELARLLA
jgi:hypothetical protein